MSNVTSLNQQKINLFPYITISTITFFLFLVLGFFIPKDISSTLINELKNTLKQLETLGPLAILLIIFMNNAIKCLFVIIMGIIVGIPSIIFIGVNGITVGMLVSVLEPQLGYRVIIASLAPHGIIEIPVIIIATALGLSIGAEFLKFVTRQSSMTKIQFTYSLRLYFKWLLLALLIASVIEVFITPAIVSLVGDSHATVIP